VSPRHGLAEVEAATRAKAAEELERQADLEGGTVGKRRAWAWKGGAPPPAACEEAPQGDEVEEAAGVVSPPAENVAETEEQEESMAKTEEGLALPEGATRSKSGKVWLNGQEKAPCEAGKHWVTKNAKGCRECGTASRGGRRPMKKPAPAKIQAAKVSAVTAAPQVEEAHFRVDVPKALESLAVSIRSAQEYAHSCGFRLDVRILPA
jgi:hypothetical protein